MILGGLETIIINGKRSYFVTTRNGYQSTNCRSTPNHYIYYFVKDGSITSLIETEEILRDEKITHSKGLTNHIRKYFDI